MKIRIIAVLLLIAVSLFAFAACNDQQGDFVSQDKAQEAAVEAAGLSISEVEDLHTHAGSVDGVPLYQVHFQHNGQEYTYLVNAFTGEVQTSG